MTKRLSIIVAVVCIMFCAGMASGTHSKNKRIRLGLMVEALCESSYFEGQRDAITGDVRIAFKNGEYEWVKSPWDEKTKEGGYATHPSESLQYR